MSIPASFGLGVGLLMGLLTTLPAAAGIPQVGESAADFTLKTPAGQSVKLSTLNAKGPIVLVVLRGWPGYQCPYCTKQVSELISQSKTLDEAKAQVVLVYPGPSEQLQAHADDFIKGKSLPGNFTFLIDPDYTFTNAYSLRWEGPKETAYPSTFVIDPQGKITYTKISRVHGGRPSIKEVMDALAKK